MCCTDNADDAVFCGTPFRLAKTLQPTLLAALGEKSEFYCLLLTGKHPVQCDLMLLPVVGVDAAAKADQPFHFGIGKAEDIHHSGSAPLQFYGAILANLISEAERRDDLADEAVLKLAGVQSLCCADGGFRVRPCKAGACPFPAVIRLEHDPSVRRLETRGNLFSDAIWSNAARGSKSASYSSVV